MMLRSLAVIAVAAFLVSPRDVAAELVVNGNFELQANGSTATTVGQVNVNTTLQAWTVGAIQNSGQAHPFVFVVDSNADSTGFPSENTPGSGNNIKLWGPNSGSNNGFTGSPNGGKFLGVDADYATASVSQTISGLTIGQQYTLSFNWAGSQFTDQSGATTQWWQIGFAGTTQDTAHTAVASKGFTGWLPSTMTFTATNTTDTLVLTAKSDPYTGGAVSGLPPFLLIDGVSLVPTSAPVPEPSTWIITLLGLGAAGIIRRRRQAKLQAIA